jgi:hypothetical protein
MQAIRAACAARALLPSLLPPPQALALSPATAWAMPAGLPACPLISHRPCAVGPRPAPEHTPACNPSLLAVAAARPSFGADYPHRRSCGPFNSITPYLNSVNAPTLPHVSAAINATSASSSLPLPQAAALPAAGPLAASPAAAAPAGLAPAPAAAARCRARRHCARQRPRPRDRGPPQRRTAGAPCPDGRWRGQAGAGPAVTGRRPGAAATCASTAGAGRQPLEAYVAAGAGGLGPQQLAACPLGVAAASKCGRGVPTRTCCDRRLPAPAPSSCAAAACSRAGGLPSSRAHARRPCRGAGPAAKAAWMAPPSACTARSCWPEVVAATSATANSSSLQETWQPEVGRVSSGAGVVLRGWGIEGPW